MSEAISSLSREIIPRPANESFQTAGDLKMRVDRGAFELSHGEYLTSLAQALA